MRRSPKLLKRDFKQVQLDAPTGEERERALADLFRLFPTLKDKPSVVYFHDNQLPPVGSKTETPLQLVNLGTAALETPEWVAKVIAEHGDKIAVGLDVRGTTLRGRGWTRDGGDLYETLERLDKEGCARYVVTDIAKDGTLQGPNLELLRNVCAATDRPVVASGGVSSLDDLRAIASVHGVEGAIVGKALYAGAFTLPEALAAVAGDGR